MVYIKYYKFKIIIVLHYFKNWW